MNESLMIKVNLALAAVTLVLALWIGSAVGGVRDDLETLRKDMEAASRGVPASTVTRAPAPYPVVPSGPPPTASAAGEPGTAAPAPGAAEPAPAPSPGTLPEPGSDSAIRELRKSMEFVGASADQRRKVEQLFAEASDKHQRALKEGGAGFDPSAHWQQALGEFEKQAMAVLTAEQRDKMKNYSPPQ